MGTAMSYVESHGLVSESEYPYKARKGTCSIPRGASTVSISSHSRVTKDSPSAMKSAVAKGPVSIAIEADKAAFQSYKSGVLSSSKCGTNLDHGVLIVGYGTDSKYGKYWKVKNSWGKTWGESGYVRLARSDSNGKGECGCLMEGYLPKY